MTLPVNVAATNDDDVTSGPRPWRRLQFGLAGLFVLTALMAVGIVLLKNFGHWGLVAITLAAFVFSGYVLKRKKENMQSSVDLVWGVGLPLLCFVYDPGILRGPDGRSAFGENIICLALWQMALLAAWVLLGPRGAVWNGLLAGGLFFGVFMSGVIGVLLVPLAFLGTLVFGAGLPGFVPLMTTYVFGRNWQQVMCSFSRREQRGVFRTAAVIGFLTAILGPLAFIAALHGYGYSLDLPRVGGVAQFPFDD